MKYGFRVLRFDEGDGHCDPEECTEDEFEGPRLVVKLLRQAAEHTYQVYPWLISASESGQYADFNSALEAMLKAASVEVDDCKCIEEVVFHQEPGADVNRFDVKNWASFWACPDTPAQLIEAIRETGVTYETVGRL